jgi:IS30 family transposase
MAKTYTQFGLRERKEIEDGLNKGLSFRAIAKDLGVSPSSVSREVKANRTPKTKPTPKTVECTERNFCKRSGVCAVCVRSGARCAGCDVRDCREECVSYISKANCAQMEKAPWVCNACHKVKYGCNRRGRYVYSAKAAEGVSAARRSDSRRGIDMELEEAEKTLATVRDCLHRGLSPYEISRLYEDSTNVSPSTIYRWVREGYGGLMAMDLERAVGFKPRTRKSPKRPTSHTPKRRYEAFLRLTDDIRGSRTEMDCVIGLKTDKKCLLTLYNVASHFQVALLLEEHTCTAVQTALNRFKNLCPKDVFQAWSRCVLTDNGCEFADEDGISKIFGEKLNGKGELEVHLYYCDPRQSQQKGGCEKNHSEIRQILPSGETSFDLLDEADVAACMSHVNSAPRMSLGGRSPIEMLRFVHGESADTLLEALGMREVPREELCLKPNCIEYERTRHS